MKIHTIQTGCTLVSPAVPDRNTRKNPYAYTGLFQRKINRIKVPVKCFYVEVDSHSFLVDAGWSKQVVDHAIEHLGYGLYFASEPVMELEEAAVNQLKGKTMDAIYMTHLDCDHASGLQDFQNTPIYASKEELNFATKKKIRYGKLLEGLNIRTLEKRPTHSRDFSRELVGQKYSNTAEHMFDKGFDVWYDKYMEKLYKIPDGNKLTYGRGYVYSLQYHIVWCTKYRKPVLKEGLDVWCKELLQEIAEQYSFQIIAMEVQKSK